MPLLLPSAQTQHRSDGLAIHPIAFYSRPAAKVTFIGSVREAICSLWGNRNRCVEGAMAVYGTIQCQKLNPRVFFSVKLVWTGHGSIPGTV